MSQTRQEFDLQTLAENGLRRGLTTGSCATAAVKAALLLLERNQTHEEVEINLPDQRFYLPIEIAELARLDVQSVKARVIKHAGDDPDCTDGATVNAIVRRNNTGVTRFIAGEGVGVVTQPGLRVAIGEAAINPVPRMMMLEVIQEVLQGNPDPGYDLTIGCENGEQLSKKTFNARLGITGGLSILGTSGIVEPMSLAAYKASIEVYISVALGTDSPRIALLPGNIGLNFAKRDLSLPQNRIVVIANFLGFSLETVSTVLMEQNRTLNELWLLGHPGKIAKILDDVWDTHSSKSQMATDAVACLAEELQLDPNLIAQIRESRTVEGIVQTLAIGDQPNALWAEVAKRCALVAHKKTDRIESIGVGLFGMNGQPLARFKT